MNQDIAYYGTWFESACSNDLYIRFPRAQANFQIFLGPMSTLTIKIECVSISAKIYIITIRMFITRLNQVLFIKSPNRLVFLLWNQSSVDTDLTPCLCPRHDFPDHRTLFEIIKSLVNDLSQKLKSIIVYYIERSQSDHQKNQNREPTRVTRPDNSLKLFYIFWD